MVFCGIPIFYAGNCNLTLNHTSLSLINMNMFAIRFTEVALGQYLGVGGII